MNLICCLQNTFIEWKGVKVVILYSVNILPELINHSNNGSLPINGNITNPKIMQTVTAIYEFCWKLA